MHGNLVEQIVDELGRGRSVVLVGNSGAGKSFFANNFLLPRLTELGKKTAYFKGCDAMEFNWNADYFITDEVGIRRKMV